MSSALSTVFVTGGAGYIGSHCIIELLEAGYEVVAVDNFVNSVNGPNGEAVALKRVESITGKKVNFYECDLLDKRALENIFTKVRYNSCLFPKEFFCAAINFKVEIKLLSGFYFILFINAMADSL